MANELEGARTLPVKFIDQADGSTAERVSTVEAGEYGYAAGSAPATVSTPSQARITRVSVIASNTANATVVIDGGDSILVPAGTAFDEKIPGATSRGASVVVGGTVMSYYVAWVVD